MYKKKKKKKVEQVGSSVRSMDGALLGCACGRVLYNGRDRERRIGEGTIGAHTAWGRVQDGCRWH